ncbi:MAG: EF-hand domain-containing protein [Alphaproteobacteria bacterium]
MKTRAKLTLLATALLVLPGVAAAKSDGDRPNRFDQMFKAVDANGDGRITAAEESAYREARFKTLDANGDGVVSAEEYTASHRAKLDERLRSHFAKLDADGDGKLSAAEAEGKRKADIMKFDANGDGAVTQDEIRAKLQAHKRGDREQAPSERKAQ